ncbi:hypothetical protein [Pantoea agglomerans]|uniref:hypothetical protein n=1 Tax=Enterobacter agglomerans TaxID=549 RepID=UPI001F5D38FD|nr:hypothetical protein [Pantoea agglomerans]
MNNNVIAATRPVCEYAVWAAGKLDVPKTCSPLSRVMFGYDGSETSRENLNRVIVSPLLN